MRPAPFEYFAPAQIPETLDLLANWGDEGGILALQEAFWEEHGKRAAETIESQS